MMSFSYIKYPTKNSCIYCRKSNVILNDEHIVPLFIGGKHVISKASCVVCENITKKFEQDVARGLWGQARASYKAPTRRPKEYAKSFILKDPKGIDEDLTVLAEDYPAPMLFYRMSLAGILAGTNPTHDLSLQWTMQAIVDDAHPSRGEAADLHRIQRPRRRHHQRCCPPL